jgi:general nucleoside transport system ATP-binding protein
VLSPPEVDELWGVLRGMRDRGDTIVLITHKLDEVMEISDSITVMRRGATVDRLRTADSSPAAIARSMVGRDVALASSALWAGDETATGTPSDPPAAGVGGMPLLQVTELRVDDRRGRPAVDGLSFAVAGGEILGVAGVEGNGQTELIEAIAGLCPVAGGRIALAGRDVSDEAVRARSDRGLSHIPEDRHQRGLILDYSIADNLILGQQHRYTAGAGMDQERIAANAERRIREYDIRPDAPALPARALSGGNQQKIVIAREMGRDFQVLLAAQPTRGVDVGAIEFIHGQLRAARQAGKAILLVSADLNEILALADRVAVMYEGRFVTVLPRAAATAEVIGPYMTGAAAQDAA